MAKFVCNVISYTLRRTVDITVVIPTPTIPEALGFGGIKPSHAPGEKYPVLYLLHGFGNNHATWTGYSNAELYAEERNMAVVMLSGENKAYINHPDDDQFYDFTAYELPEFITAMFPVSHKPEHTYIAGLSMGGFGTLVHALNRPEAFRAFGAFSAAISLKTSALRNNRENNLQRDKRTEADPRYDPLALARNLEIKEGRFPKAYIACGEEDSLFKGNAEYAKLLKQKGADVTWVQLPKYQHEWRFWDLQIEAFLDWLPRTDIYAVGGKRKV